MIHVELSRKGSNGSKGSRKGFGGMCHTQGHRETERELKRAESGKAKRVNRI